MFKHKMIVMATLLCFALHGRAMADDTEIYGISSGTLEPNVMIIMDNSGSMQTKDVGGENYNRTKIYSNFPNVGWTPVPFNAVYYETSVLINGVWVPTWNLFTDDVAKISCFDARTALINTGYVSARIRTSDMTCNTRSTRYNLRLGNYQNYENSTMERLERCVVAIKAIADLLRSDAVKDIKFGIMHFNTNALDGNNVPIQPEGGYVKFGIGAKTNTELATYLDGNLDRVSNEFVSSASTSMKFNDFNTWTPLAETLAEAGRYYAGLSSWFNTGTSYTTPITHVCQKNYVIIMTDGEPTQDRNHKLYDTIYMNSKYINDYYVDLPISQDLDSSGNPKIFSSNGTKMLDDVAAFLYKEDMFPGWGSGTYHDQIVITHTIGLKEIVPILSDTAAHGGGKYSYANTSDTLKEALEKTIGSINESNAVFLAPAVPVSRTTRTKQSDWIYLAYFRPQTTGEWLGNIKKFAIGENTKGEEEVYASDGAGNIIPKNVVDIFGMIDNNAWSFWTAIGPDGNEVLKGGIGEALNSMATRNIYYYTGTDPILKNSTNLFSVDNASLLVEDDVITSVRNFTDDWKLGAIIHSEPAIVHYSSSQSVIYVGANDAMIHCFDDNNGKELWAFIPPGQKNNLPKISDALRDYYVDASPTISYKDELITEIINGHTVKTQLFKPDLMIIGERRGGSNYYVLDINDYNNPKWKYQIDDLILGVAAPLGQSWCKPRSCTISTGLQSGAPIPEKVFMIAGGYDSLNQDDDTPAATDSKGIAIFSIKTSEKTLTGFKVTNATAGIGAYMKNSIVDISTAATYRMTDGTNITTKVYAGDLGGKVFTFADDREIVDGKVKARTPDGSFPIKNCLFSAPGKKIFYAPATSKMSNSYTEWTVFGTGNRENPLDVSQVNRVYAVKNSWLKSNLTEANLENLTENLIAEGSDDDRDDALSNIEKKDGWYITFYDPGEKMISSPIISNGYVFFTTYVPSTDSTGTDVCATTGAAGTSYLWAIDLETGIPAYDQDKDKKFEKPERRIEVAVMAQPKSIGDTITTPKMISVPESTSFDYIFWRQR